MTRRIFSLDINWRREAPPSTAVASCSSHHFADIDADAFFDYHRQFDITEFWMPVTNWAGYAYYPTRLNCVAGGSAGQLFPRIWEWCQEEGLPCWGYFCIGTDLHIANTCPDWVLPGTKGPNDPWPMLAPDSPWIDLVEARIVEFLQAYPVQSIMLDWFTYGYASMARRQDPLVPTRWMQEPFRKLFSRSLPETAAGITADEALAYRRHVLGRNAERLVATIRKIQPDIEITFNMPYDAANDPMWVDHQVLHLSDMLFAECSREDVVNWLLEVRQSHQRVMCMIHGRPEEEQCSIASGANWISKGCDLFASALPVAPTIQHHPIYNDAVEQIKALYRQAGT